MKEEKQQKVYVVTFERKIKGCAPSSMVVGVYADREKAIGTMTSMFLSSVEQKRMDYYGFDKDFSTDIRVDRMMYCTNSDDPEVKEYLEYKITNTDLIV